MTLPVYATYRLYVDWDDDGDFSEPDEDVSADLLDVPSIHRGMSGPMARVQSTGTATFVLNNTSRAYSPPEQGNVLPRRRVRFEMTYGGTTEKLFTGYLTKIEPTVGIMEAIKTVTLRCVDEMDTLERFEGEIDLLTNVYANDIIDAVVSASLTPDSTDYDQGINMFPAAADRWSGKLTIPGPGGAHVIGVVQEVRASDKILDACTADWGTFFIAKDGTPTFRNRHAMPLDTSVELTLDNVQAGMSYQKSDEGIINHVSVTCYPRKVGSVHEVLGRLSQTDAPIVEPGATVTYDIPYRDPSNNAMSIGGASVITPVPGTDFVATSDAEGEGDDLSASLTPSMAAYGDHAEVSLENTGAVPARLQWLQVRGIGVRSYDAATVIAQDTASILAYKGRRKLQINAVLMSNLAHAQELADYLLDYYKDPLDEIQSLAVHANVNATLLAAARDLELLDRVVVSEDQTGLDAVAFHVYSITHAISGRTGQHVITLGLMRAYEYAADPWTWDESTWDDGDVWIY